MGDKLEVNSDPFSPYKLRALAASFLDCKRHYSMMIYDNFLITSIADFYFVEA